MNAIEPLLRPVAAMINRQVRAKTPARELCRELDGRTFALRVPDTALAMYLTVDNDRVILSGDYVDDPEVVATGSLISLARLAGPAADDLIRDGAVNIEGDAVVASQFRKLLRYGQPDLEEELSAVIGDVAAHGIGNFVRGMSGWTREAGATMQQNIGEYLQEESRAVPGRHEADEFRNDVNSLRDDVARFEARLRKIEEGRT
ncbi:MAG: SCP2 sterol-binding domain-containing protein [Gammaproteobacteria bacterium]|nr:SCP2 sterol-binding domain-containing protein [Gammaproteobacteria bacterium]